MSASAFGCTMRPRIGVDYKLQVDRWWRDEVNFDYGCRMPYLSNKAPGTSTEAESNPIANDATRYPVSLRRSFWLQLELIIDLKDQRDDGGFPGYSAADV
ncbi:hypothetical protein M231_01078 [Tremella mesenterica]|uniref:Uncharacterized protein n=1 Tax=Tremella mesenterica TaxID=5217 RepID=A0A4Q1BU10_TREME|nr:hypothetical protein M231_01078 [Tremella mesenterica]